MSQNFLRSLAAQAGWIAVRIGGRQLVSSATFFVFASKLEPAEFGEAAMATSIAFLGRLVVDRGITDYVVQQREDDAEVLSNCFYAALGLSIAALLSATAACLLISTWVNPQYSATMLATSCLVVPIIGFSRVHEGLARKHLKFRRLALYGTISAVLSAAAGLAASNAGFGAWAVVLFTLLEAGTFTTLLLVAEPWRPTSRIHLGHIRHVASVSWKIIINSALTIGNLRFIEVMVGVATTPAGAAAFRLGTQANRILTQVVREPVNQALLPLFRRSHVDDAMARDVLVAITTSTFTAFGPYMICAAAAPAAFAYLLGDEWGTSGIVAQILLIALLGHSLLSITGPAYIAAGLSHRALAQSVVFFSSCAAFSTAGTLLGGPIGGSVGFALSGLIVAPSQIYALSDAFQVRKTRLTRAIILPATAATAAFTVTAYIAAHPSARSLFGLALAAVVGAGVYLIAATGLVAAFDRRTAGNLARLLRLRVKRGRG